MKRILSVLVIVLVICSLCGCENGSVFPTHTKEFYVNDFANIISDSDEDAILSRGITLNKKTTAQVVVVTVENLGGYTPEDYALEIGREWGVGDKEANNGVVILLSVEEREIYIAVGYGLEGALPDSKTGRIIDVYGLAYLKANDFSKGLTEINRAIINEVYIEYGIEPEEGYVNIDNLQSELYGEESPEDVSTSWIILIIILVIFFTFFGRGRGPFIFLGGPNMYRGHSGRSGGSFGGFSGGGGSFGGGGAGRGF